MVEFNKTVFTVLVTLIVLLFAYQEYLIRYQLFYKQNTDQQKVDQEKVNQQKVNQQVHSEINLEIDPVIQYDYNKYVNPLEQPTRRVARHEIHPIHVKQMIDLPSRGYPDNFTQIGVLVQIKNKKNKKSKNKNKMNNQNNILRLFGRQEYPGSNRYEYYVMINSGLDQIKLPLELRRQELYDGDTVVVKQLNQRYEVNLYKYDAPRYYPDVL